jgi:hypothetical protein
MGNKGLPLNGEPLLDGEPLLEQQYKLTEASKKVEPESQKNRSHEDEVQD